ncbi:MAG: GH32 C-terminal domain-containing protein [Butyrivibrio sp.]|nr:GH32 C-terminal domain-containing protein [Butyrivibrio sp.]
MISEKLQQAREYEKEGILRVPSDQRPCFHITAPIGWINDPNGFSTYKGWYHLFYQYHPYSTHWGPMHWGHVRTKDFIKWEQLPAAIAPDMKYDKDGCFSGSAIEMPDGRHMLMYTSVVRKEDEDGVVRDYQQQAVAFGDGINYEKAAANPVITTAMIPEKNDKHDFRDPKIFIEDDTFFCLVGNRGEDGSGELLLYSSTDGLNWKNEGVIDKCNNEYGRMWECPDYFELDGKQILIVSPQEMKGDGNEFHPGNGTVLFIGQKNTNHIFKRESVQTTDFGMDFYAPQTIKTKDGRRVMIGWMQNWETCNVGNEKRMIYGQMSVPRELTIKDGRVCQTPVREIENYYGKKISYEDVSIGNGTICNGIKGRILDLTVELDLEKNPGLANFTVELCKNDKFCTEIILDAVNKSIRFSREKSGVTHDIINVREFKVSPENGKYKLRFIMDKYSIELFVNDGEKTASAMVDTPLEADEIGFSADKMAVANISMAELKFD